MIASVLVYSVEITLFVFVMMLITDYINVLSRGKLTTLIRGGRWRQYSIASLLGATPGCLGAFMNVSFYVRGLLSFGAMVGGMIATSGDEAYVMIALFPRTALLLFGLLFIIGVIFAWITDKIVPLLRIVPCAECELSPLHPDDEKCRCFDAMVWKKFPHISSMRYILLLSLVVLIVIIGTGILGPHTWGWARITLFTLLIITIYIIATVPQHYLKEHIFNHIVKEHIWRVFLWTFFALLFIHIGLKYWNLEGFVKVHVIWVLLLSGFIGIIPESGPHFIFVTMFARGLVPFSVLLTSSIVQDGHGMLPLLSYTVKDSILIKTLNLVIGLTLGGILYGLGL